MRLLIDGDSCPVLREAEQIANRYGLPVIVFADIQRCIHAEYAKVVYVYTAKGAADRALLNKVKPGDIVLTNDYGLAALALMRGASCIHSHGFVYTEENILPLLTNNHLAKQLRKRKRRKKMVKYGPKTRCNFTRDFPVLIEETIKKNMKHAYANSKTEKREDTL